VTICPPQGPRRVYQRLTRTGSRKKEIVPWQQHRKPRRMTRFLPWGPHWNYQRSLGVRNGTGSRKAGGFRTATYVRHKQFITQRKAPHFFSNKFFNSKKSDPEIDPDL
jgi:hypothetical protein